MVFFHSESIEQPIGSGVNLSPSIPNTNYTVEFHRSESPQSQSFTLSPVDDDVLSEPNEFFQLTFASISDARVIQGPASSVLIIDDDDIG